MNDTKCVISNTCFGMWNSGIEQGTIGDGLELMEQLLEPGFADSAQKWHLCLRADMNLS